MYEAVIAVARVERPAQHHRADEFAPVGKAAAVMRRRTAPEQLVAEMQVDPVNTVAARDEGSAEAIEKAGNRPLQKQEGAGSPCLRRAGSPFESGDAWAY